VSGQFFGRVKAMFDERNQKKKEAGPSTPVLILGLNGAPQAGEKFKVYEDEAEAKEIAYKRGQILREQASVPVSILHWMKLAAGLHSETSKNLMLLLKVTWMDLWKRLAIALRN
jgi:translation initiation factor IF-2